MHWPKSERMEKFDRAGKETGTLNGRQIEAPNSGAGIVEGSAS
jgi:hypothetical protein